VSELCDTLVPPLETPEGGPRAELLGRSASDLGLPALVEAALDDAPAAVGEALTALDVAGWAEAPPARREAILRERLEEPRLREVAGMVLALFYASSGEKGWNPNWSAIGYPGPCSAPPAPELAPKTIAVATVTGERATLTADVCVVGSGAGGSVVAAELQAAGRSVVVIERGLYRNESDFRQLEDVGARELFLRGGMFFSVDGSLGLLAGSTLGGGTVVNSMVCLAPPEHVLSDWAATGLDGVNGQEFYDHIEAVSARLEVNTAATVQNRTSRLIANAIEELGLSWQTIPRNAAARDDPRFCGYCHYGCQHGFKRSTLKTYLQDAADTGSRFVVGCTAERILVRDGRAAGVAARVVGPHGSSTALEVKAPTVVVAAGGIESPALLLRSGLGGPAAGRHLRVHPTYFVGGIYDEPVRGWEGQVQSVVSLDRTRAVGGVGYLVECTTLSPGMWAVLSPWTGGEDHKRRMLALEHTAPWHAVCHDHGSGRVTLDTAGAATVHWSLRDPVDRALASLGHVELAQMHRLAGAREIVTSHTRGPRWREGEDFDSFLSEIGSERADTRAFSAHQMGSCRMGRDPASSVADTRGELHDVDGVWIGDASAFPTAPGVNPMITVMALARRTARRMLEGGRR
jgi:choline dehydrogenase-like flavoprotein